VVLAQMAKYGYISAAVKDTLQQTNLDLKYTPESHRDGTATYFRTYLEGYMKAWISANPKANGETWNLYNDGLKIYTTIDARMQRHAEQLYKPICPDCKRLFSSKIL
jgi:penicillin-binding protein 1A